MSRVIIGIVALMSLASPCAAKMYKMFTPPELVGIADVIVIGTVTETGKESRVKVTAMLLGKANETIGFPTFEDLRFKVNESHIIFRVNRKEKLVLIHPFTYLPPDRADEIRRLVEMKTHPKKYLDDAKQAGTVDFLVILGYAFAGADKVGELKKSTAVARAGKTATRNWRPTSARWSNRAPRPTRN